jgi:hypothetical protein
MESGNYFKMTEFWECETENKTDSYRRWKKEETQKDLGVGRYEA